MKQELLSKKKKGNLDMVVPAVFAVMIIGVIVGIGVLILSGFDDATSDATASEAFNDSLTAIMDFIDWLPLIVVVVIAVVLLGLIFLIYRYRGKAGA